MGMKGCYSPTPSRRRLTFGRVSPGGRCDRATKLMAETTPANLFAAARSYVVAMMKLLPEFEHGMANATAMPYYLLAGFAFELSLKAVILRTGSDHTRLRRLGHDLTAIGEAAVASGFVLDELGMTSEMIDRLSTVHKGLVFRYVPDVEVINLPSPARVLQTLSALLQHIEASFDVWCDLGVDPSTAQKCG